MMGNVFESAADVLFAMTGAIPSAGRHSGAWWRRRFLESLILVAGFLAAVSLFGGHGAV